VKRLLLLASLAVLAAGCGGGATNHRSTKAGHAADGPREVWYYPARGDVKSVVVFLHGYGGAREETPANHVPWLRHLVQNGSDVIYPRYEEGGSLNPYSDLDIGVQVARTRLGHPHVPTVVIGYSRGGRLAVDYAAFEAAHDREPAAVLCVFPGLNSPGEKLASLDLLDSKTRIVLWVGDHDTGVDGVGARAILARLATFSATHLSVLESGPGAREAFWGPTDRLIESVR
jgi:pimeloyl-ACP methyl ester carboxylesterase